MDSEIFREPNVVLRAMGSAVLVFIQRDKIVHKFHLQNKNLNTLSPKIHLTKPVFTFKNFGTTPGLATPRL